MMNDKAFRQAHEDKHWDFFKKADANKNGVLNEAEYTKFLNLMIEDDKAGGQFADDRPENAAKQYALFNLQNCEKGGVSLADWKACMG